MTARNMGKPLQIKDILQYTGSSERDVSLVYKAIQKSNIFPNFDARLKVSDLVLKACKIQNISSALSLKSQAKA